MSTEADPVDSQELIAAYKAILRDVLDKRPSGMRQRLAEALGKNRSFITQIANPAYQTPIPAQHVHPIIQICHFSAQEKDRFLEAYHRAHPRRAGVNAPARRCAVFRPGFRRRCPGRPGRRRGGPAR